MINKMYTLVHLRYFITSTWANSVSFSCSRWPEMGPTYYRKCHIPMQTFEKLYQSFYGFVKTFFAIISEAWWIFRKYFSGRFLAVRSLYISSNNIIIQAPYHAGGGGVMKVLKLSVCTPTPENIEKQ